MKPTIEGEVALAFVMGGISKKSNKPYLQVSDGVEAVFVNIGEDMHIDSETFEKYERGDLITFEASVDPFRNRITILEIK